MAVIKSDAYGHIMENLIKTIDNHVDGYGTVRIEEAIRIRKVFGGGMRQSGYLAACGIYALENNIQRLSDDHKRAKEIEKVLKGLDFITKVEEVETNIIIFEIHEKFSSENFINHLSKQGVKLIGMGDNKLRLVTHMDYTQNHHDYFLDLLKNVSL